MTQPYDKITPSMLEEYLRRHPHNIARVIKNSNYEEAGEHLLNWIGEGVMKQDGESCFYPYEQIFDLDGSRVSRLGFICLTSLGDSNLTVRGHERVLQAPLQDRLDLIRQTRSNEGLIFMLHSQPSMRVDEILSQAIEREDPEIQVADEYGVMHRLWCLADRSIQDQISDSLEESRFYIADGHHRFQTSVLFQQECLEQGLRETAPESFDKRMIALFNMESPSLRILATHRGLRNLPDLDDQKLLSDLSQNFHVRPMEGVDGLDAEMGNGGHCLALVSGAAGRIHLLRLKEGMADSRSFMPDLSGPARGLDVNILHEGIFKAYLGIGPEEVASQKYVDYFRDRQELIRGVCQGRYQLGFLLNPTRLNQVREVSERGEKMPQKSTDFYPKLLTGLVLMRMEFESSNKIQDTRYKQTPNSKSQAPK